MLEAADLPSLVEQIQTMLVQDQVNSAGSTALRGDLHVAGDVGAALRCNARNARQPLMLPRLTPSQNTR